MEQGNAIEVRNVEKYFKVYEDKGKMLRERIIHWNRNHYERREVLKGISFDVKKGEAVGLIGSNGCGKSTTLKILTKILRPNSGTVEMNGKVYSMIELGAGFHPDLSGRENIYNNASIFGVKAKEVDERLDDIIEFSELQQFIDNPVRTYSSGMYMRLAFAVAINIEADIMLIDEILAVGDAAFQAKCFNKLRDIKRNGTTIVLVSHSLGQVEQLCDRSIWIKDGHIEAEGKPRDVHPLYMEYMGEKQQAPKPKAVVVSDEEKDAKITGIKLLNAAGEDVRKFNVEDACSLEVEYKVKKEVPNALFSVKIYRNDGIACYKTSTKIERFEEFKLTKDGSFKFKMDRLSLIAGSYWMDISIESGDGFPVDYKKEALTFEVTSKIPDAGVTRIAHQWESEAFTK